MEVIYMKKGVNFCIQMVVYFLVVLLSFFIAKKLGFAFKDSSVLLVAIGSTVGWLVVQGFIALKNRK